MTKGPVLEERSYVLTYPFGCTFAAFICVDVKVLELEKAAATATAHLQQHDDDATAAIVLRIVA